MRIEFDSYCVDIVDDSISIFLGGRCYCILKIASLIDTPEAVDSGAELPKPEIDRGDRYVRVVWKTRSELWEEKTYCWRFEPDVFWYEVRVKGQSPIKEVRYFDGGAAGRSSFDFSQFFTPECNLADQRYFKSLQYGCIDATTGQMNSSYAVDPYVSMHWMFTPPPFCYSLGFSSGSWLGAGVAPEMGEYNFSRFEYLPGADKFCFRLTYDGMIRADGEWRSPKMVFCPAENEYSALEKYCDTLRAEKLVNENRYERAEWWSKPIFCGWGEQNVQSAREGRGRWGQALATQQYYDKFLSIIRDKGLKPGTIVIDDKWQKYYGTLEVDAEKWPDLRGWIDARHAEGLKVLLWYGAWHAEGLPDDELTIDEQGTKLVDPTNPTYQQRIKEYMHRMLSPDSGCYNADGIKYDWTNSLPSKPGFEIHGDLWGIELLKSLTQQLYDAAKAAKPDALFITHTPNPYFSECTDMVRLNDIYRGCREIVSMMTHRAKIAHIACPQALIDCDNSSAPTHTEWLEYTRMQPELGVPSLYFLTAVDGTMEPITDEDWEVLAPIWRV